MIPEATKQSVIEMIKEGKTYAEMEEDLGISTSTMSKIKRDAILEGHIFPTTRGRKSNLLYPNQEAGPSSSSSPSKNPTSSNPSQPTKKRGRPRKSHAQTLANSTGTINPAATSTLQSQGSRPKKKLGRPPKHATGLQGQQNASSSASSPSSSSSSPIAPTNQVSGAGGGGGGRPKGRYAINEKEEKQLVRWAAGPNPINATEMAQRINKNKEKPQVERYLLPNLWVSIIISNSSSSSSSSKYSKCIRNRSTSPTTTSSSSSTITNTILTTSTSNINTITINSSSSSSNTITIKLLSSSSNTTSNNILSWFQTLVDPAPTSEATGGRIPTLGMEVEVLVTWWTLFGRTNALAKAGRTEGKFAKATLMTDPKLEWALALLDRWNR
ncbi:hypothetical protein IE53DRAFT_362509 [Violaceomyces palustris]|uniref:Uncharacterized protein n=1 Tax=Violaceomyces palustris TaxID=1673888 RepID=A0ACD0NWW9_9BASI|nr:hypothetical protein IE53DRAFT_362509 [Violaceomyces palustris]